MILQRAYEDAEFYNCILEVRKNPTPATLEKWINHPTLGPLVEEIFQAIKSKSMGQQ
ncbi:hypothetical protein MNEG_3485 [Monoraphidium neglectum]|uniref:Uncharacterized protein n=1 Tax=Monoraphidium neglectum TaxID=145388 RepID=A0A0D2MVD0_9CHLO|nr:hypothetical protein MNEG_3485 [Monoraphidium neglectum]KIZ04472.1 hypothetical protein MNEG_3485 [Monoraphidium neglectum]|eukprot:XP_013903491.1 hypothetical protein MNEG_3485 [Monoraphidium neglectum]